MVLPVESHYRCSAFSQQFWIRCRLLVNSLLTACICLHRTYFRLRFSFDNEFVAEFDYSLNTTGSCQVHVYGLNSYPGTTVIWTEQDD